MSADTSLQWRLMALAKTLGCDELGFGCVSRSVLAKEVPFEGDVYYISLLKAFSKDLSEQELEEHWRRIAILLESIAQQLSRHIISEGYKALPLPVDIRLCPSCHYHYSGLCHLLEMPVAVNKRESILLFDHRRAAVETGLGFIGKSGLLISPKYGPRVVVTSLITNAPFQPTSKLLMPYPCESCNECVKACPVGAITDEGVVYSKCLNNSNTAKCWKCLLACPIGRGK